MDGIKILAFSDTHRSRPVLKFAKTVLALHRPDMFVHAGDNYLDYRFLEKSSGIQGVGVCGNCDYGVPGCSQEQVIALEDFKILLCHGHQYDVKRSYYNIFLRAREVRANIAVFGHTHRPALVREQNITLFNPGSLYHPRGDSGHSYGIIEIKEGEAHCRTETTESQKIFGNRGVISKIFN